MKVLKWLDNNLEQAILLILLCGMTIVMGGQIIARYAFSASLSWSEELTRYLFIWCGFLSVSYCTKKFHSPYLREYRKIGHPTGAVTAECDAYKMTQDYGC